MFLDGLAIPRDESAFELAQLSFEFVDTDLEGSAVVEGGGLDAHDVTRRARSDLDLELLVGEARVALLGEFDVCEGGAVEDPSCVCDLLLCQ